MQTATAQVSTAYQIVIPRAVRKALGIKPRDQVIFIIDEDRVYLRLRPKSFIEKLSDLHTHVWRQPSDEWLHKERESWDE